MNIFSIFIAIFIRIFIRFLIPECPSMISSLSHFNQLLYKLMSLSVDVVPTQKILFQSFGCSLIYFTNKSVAVLLKEIDASHSSIVIYQSMTTVNLNNILSIKKYPAKKKYFDQFCMQHICDRIEKMAVYLVGKKLTLHSGFAWASRHKNPKKLIRPRPFGYCFYISQDPKTIQTF